MNETKGKDKCAVTDASGAEVAKGPLTAFQPEGEVTPETLEAYT